MSINQEYQSTEFQVIFRLYKFEFIPDGKPLKKLHLIIQDRKSALFFHDRAKSIGIDGVYYIDSHPQEVWNPFYQHDNNEII